MPVLFPLWTNGHNGPYDYQSSPRRCPGTQTGKLRDLIVVEEQSNQKVDCDWDYNKQISIKGYSRRDDAMLPPALKIARSYSFNI